MDKTAEKAQMEREYQLWRHQFDGEFTEKLSNNEN
jgi:hypothetical protein